MQRDRFTCRYCGRSAPSVELEVDHVLAIASGGGSGDDNLVTSCTGCNAGKSNKLAMAPQATSEYDRAPRSPFPIGWYFFELDEHRHWGRAGRVIEEVAERVFRVETFSAMELQFMGRLSVAAHELIPFAEMRRWLFEPDLDGFGSTVKRLNDSIDDRRERPAGTS